MPVACALPSRSSRAPAAGSIPRAARPLAARELAAAGDHHRGPQFRLRPLPQAGAGRGPGRVRSLFAAPRPRRSGADRAGGPAAIRGSIRQIRIRRPDAPARLRPHRAGAGGHFPRARLRPAYSVDRLPPARGRGGLTAPAGLERAGPPPPVDRGRRRARAAGPRRADGSARRRFGARASRREDGTAAAHRGPARSGDPSPDLQREAPPWRGAAAMAERHAPSSAQGDGAAPRPRGGGIARRLRPAAVFAMIWDVAICGGGPAGLATAIRAAEAGFATVLYERAPGVPDKACGEGLMPRGLAALSRLSVLPGIDPAACAPFRGIRYLQEDGARVEARFRDGEGLGIRRLALERALRERALAAGAELKIGRAARR